MIDLEKLSAKLQNIFNGTDSETINFNNGDYFFKFATAGFHLDSIRDDIKGKNFIPCFLEQVGGENDPVPDLDKFSFVGRITLYYPVRFKPDFYALCDAIQHAFVGKVKTIDGKAYLFTTDIPTYGELQQLDLSEFAKWVENIYQRKLEVMEYYMSMAFNIYLTSADGVIWGNQVEYGMQYKIGNTLYPDNSDSSAFMTLKWAENGSGVTHEPISQQLINTDDYAKNVLNITSRSKSYMAYLDLSTEKSRNFWLPLLNAYNNGQTASITDIKIKKEYKGLNLSFTSDKLVLLDIRENVQYGNPISFVITLGDAL